MAKVMRAVCSGCVKKSARSRTVRGRGACFATMNPSRPPTSTLDLNPILPLMAAVAVPRARRRPAALQIPVQPQLPLRVQGQARRRVAPVCGKGRV